MNKIKKAVYASGGSKVKDVRIGKNVIDKPSFRKGFLIGFISSLAASLVFYLILKYFIN